jgi:hypothetical protein
VRSAEAVHGITDAHLVMYNYFLLHYDLWHSTNTGSVDNFLVIGHLGFSFDCRPVFVIVLVNK